jgi:hypothetical protein
VLLAYVDESYTASRYYIAAVVIPAEQAVPLTRSLDEVVRAAVGHGAVWGAELHGHDIFHGKQDWEGLESKPRARIGVYNQAFQALADHDVRIFISGVAVDLLHQRYDAPDPPHSIALTFLLERIDEYAARVDELVLVIADEVNGQDEHRRSLWSYQRSGTWGYRARRLERIVDTIHFAPSSSSRLVQAADLVAFFYRRLRVHTELDDRAKRANDALWGRIEPQVHWSRCWFP